VTRSGPRRRAAAQLALALAFGAFLSGTAAAAPESSPADELRVELFTRSGCPHCTAAKRYLDELAARQTPLAIVERDVGRDPEARARLARLADLAGVHAVGVPAFHVRGKLVIGWVNRETTGAQIEAALAGAATSGASEGGAICLPSPEISCEPPAGGDAVEVPLLGRLSAERLGLPLFTLALGLADGFNPCAMWVLMYLLAILAGVRQRGRMVAIAGSFVVTSGVVYFLFMAAWLNVFRLLGASRLVEVLLGAVALVVAGLNLKDAAVFQRGPSLSIPEPAKPGLYARVRRIAQAPGLWAAVAGAVALALVVNLFELLCTAGFPAVYTHILASRALPAWKRYGYLALYNAAYVLDDAVMVTIAVVTLSRRRLQERGGRILKGLSGAIMLALALVLLFKPGWLR
jgi:glutaredoxin